jgi:dTMP kinase
MKTESPIIVIDGLDGCGKGTQADLLRSRFQREGREIHFTREPGGAEFSEDIRSVIKSPRGATADVTTIFLLFWAARKEWLTKDVLPSLEKGIPVLTDRGDSSTFAYQVRAEQHPELSEWCFEMREHIFGDNKPAQYIFLEVSPAVARTRAISDKSRSVSYFDAKPLAYYERVAQGFKDFAAVVGNAVFIDGMRDPEVIHEELYQKVKEVCGW